MSSIHAYANRAIRATLLTVVCVLGASVSASAGQVTLAWDSNTESDLAGYIVHVGTASGTYQTTINVGNVVNYTVTGLVEKQVYYFAVRAYNTAGVQSGLSAEVSAAVPDRTPPAISAVASSPTEAASTITWTTDEPSDTQIEYGLSPQYGSLSSLNVQLVLAHGATLTNLASDTLYYFRVRSRDAAGNLAVSPGSTFRTAALNPPAVSITAPVAGSSVTGTVTLSATASADRGVAAVRFDVDGQPLGPELTAAPYTTTWNTTSVSDGTHTLTAVVRDVSGIIATSAPITVSVSNASRDVTAPVISGVVASVNGSGATITWTTDEASDSQVEYGTTTAYGQLTPLNSTVVTTHSVALSGLSSPATYYYRVKSRDAAGNLATSANYTFATSDTVAPNVAITSPVANAIVSGVVTLAASASDNVGVVSVQFRVNNVNVGPPDTAPPYSMSWDTRQLVGGTYQLRAVARDAAGNSKASTAVKVTVAADTTAPILSGVSASPTPTTAVIRWVSDEASDSQVEYGLTTAYGTTSPLDTVLVTSHAVTLVGLAENTSYQYRLRSRDASGNLATSGNLTFTTVDATPPTVTVTAPLSASGVSGIVSLEASATDNVAVVGVRFTIDGVPFGVEQTASPYSTAWDTSSVADGVHTIAAVARDAAGHVTTSAAVTVTVSNGVLRLWPQDTTLVGNTTIYAGNAMLMTYTWPDRQVANAILMKFDLAALPPGAIVQEATLRLALLDADAGAAAYTVSAHKVLGKNPVVAKATGYTADGATPWTANPCCYGDAPMAQADMSLAYDTRAVDRTIGDKTWTLTQMVQEWVADPFSNFGVVLNADAAVLKDRYRYFASMEHATATLRPYLDIRYVATPPADSTPPAISVAAPLAGAVVAGPVTLTADATDNVGVVAVQFNVDGAPFGPELVAAPFSISWDSRLARDGVHTITATARDAAGNTTAASAVSVTVQNTISAVVRLAPQDTTLVGNATIYAGNAMLMAYTWPDRQVANAILMKFDLAALPHGAIVQEATLRLALLDSDAGAAAYTVSAHKVLGRNPVVANATGYTADGATPWTANPCCYGNAPMAQADISLAYDARAVDRTVGDKTWTLTQMVQEWVTDPFSNFGVVLNADAAALKDRYRYFASMEHATTTLRPYLEVKYTLKN